MSWSDLDHVGIAVAAITGCITVGWGLMERRNNKRPNVDVELLDPTPSGMPGGRVTNRDRRHTYGLFVMWADEHGREGIGWNGQIGPLQSFPVELSQELAGRDLPGASKVRMVARVSGFPRRDVVSKWIKLR
jgi:hypothetical protein